MKILWAVHLWSIGFTSVGRKSTASITLTSPSALSSVQGLGSHLILPSLPILPKDWLFLIQPQGGPFKCHPILIIPRLTTRSKIICFRLKSWIFPGGSRAGMIQSHSLHWHGSAPWPLPALQHAGATPIQSLCPAVPLLWGAYPPGPTPPCSLCSVSPQWGLFWPACWPRIKHPSSTLEPPCSALLLLFYQSTFFF